MAHAHQNSDLLLEAIIFRPLLHARRLREYLDGVPLAGGFLDAEVYLGEMALAQLVERSVLLQESTGGPALGIPKDEARLVQDSDFVVFLQLPAFVPAYYCFVNKSPIAGQIFENGDGIIPFILGKDKGVPIRDYGIINYDICRGELVWMLPSMEGSQQQSVRVEGKRGEKRTAFLMPSYQIATGSQPALLGLYLELFRFPALSPRPGLCRNKGFRFGAGATVLLLHHQAAAAILSIEGKEVSPDAFFDFIFHLVCESRIRVDRLTGEGLGVLGRRGDALAPGAVVGGAIGRLAGAALRWGRGSFLESTVRSLRRQVRHGRREILLLRNGSLGVGGFHPLGREALRSARFLKRVTLPFKRALKKQLGQLFGRPLQPILKLGLKYGSRRQARNKSKKKEDKNRVRGWGGEK